MVLSTQLSKSGRCFAITAVLLSLFKDAAVAQSFNASTVSASERTVWCRAQINTCQLVCESAGSNVSNEDNTCNTNDLSTTCTCLNGFAPDLARYTNTISYFECQSVYQDCLNANSNDASAIQTCEQENAAFCSGGSTDDITTVYKITSTDSAGSKSTSNITLTLVEAAAAATSSGSSSSSSTIRSSSSSSTSTPAASTGTAPSTPSPTPTSKSGISTGVLAAAIVVPVVVVILIAIGLIFFYRRRRAARTQEKETGTTFEKAELHGEAVKPTELPIQERFEMDGEGIPREMVANEEPAHEMGPTTPVNHNVQR